MGAWAEDAFGNDTACDWAGDFTDDPSMEKIESAIDEVVSEEDYIDSGVACEALVACELIARLKGNWGQRSAYSESIDKWVESCKESPSEELVRKASAVIQKTLGENSELKELWDEDGINADWHKEMDDLAKRVAG